MKKLRYFLFSVALVVLMILPLQVLADQGAQPKESQKAPSLPQTTENVAVQKETTEAITATPVRGPAASKNFTLTKTAGGTETTIGDYDVFNDVINAMDINDATSLYTIYLNKNTTIPSSEGSQYRSNNKIRLTSRTSDPFTLTREGEHNYIAIQQDAELTIDNIILDGNKDGECLFISNNGKVTIGTKTTIQNFADSPKYDGPAIYLTGGTLTIEDGALLKYNTANQAGGVIQAYNGTTVNINGGIFRNNASNTSDGGAIAAYGELNITGGSFESNSAKKTGGAIIVGANGSGSIEKATFKANKASTGGAIYALRPLTIADSSFEGNQANWGGAVFGTKKLTLHKDTFKGNQASVAGGAAYLSGGAEIQETQFTENTAANQGGAIFTVDKDYFDPADTSKYQNLSTDDKTLFQGNTALDGLSVPPSNYGQFGNLQFDSNSDVQHGVLTEKSLLNNYDVNYKNPNQVKVTFDANGGAFADNTTTKKIPAIIGKTVTLVQQPVKTDYTFTGWNTKADGTGETFDANTVIKTDMKVYAQWKKPDTPTPKPDPKPSTPILRIVKIDGDGNRIPLPVTFKITDKMISSINRIVTTDTSGEAKVDFLATGDYSLQEIKTPEGYIPLDKPLSFSVKDGRVHYENQIVRTIYVKNDKKAETPDVIKSIDDPTRQDIAATISKTYFGDARKVILVQNMAYADSMSAMNVSQGNIPILYTQKDALFDVTKQEILRTERDEIIVMGGPGTISEKVIDELKAMTNAKITRVGGIDRFEVNKNSAAYLPESTNAVIASGMIYTDALSSVPYAHQWKAPILLVREDRVPEFVADVLKARIRDAVISGGEGTIAPETKQAIEAMIGKTVSRVDGADRYVVSAKMAEMVMNPTNAILTSGEKWSDALVAGPVAQKLNAPVLLTKQANLPMPIDAYLNTHTDLEQILIVGGSASVGESVRNAVKAIFPVK